jgi:oligopeptidase B
MRDRESPELLAHLTAERAFYDAATGHLSSRVEVLRAEMTDRLPATDRSVSWRRQGFSYYTEVPAGREYAQLLRDIDIPAASAPPIPQESGAAATDPLVEDSSPPVEATSPLVEVRGALATSLETR